MEYKDYYKILGLDRNAEATGPGKQLENHVKIIQGSAGCFIRHAREGGHPGYDVPTFLDSCLPRNDGPKRRKLLYCSNNYCCITQTAL